MTLNKPDRPSDPLQGPMHPVLLATIGVEKDQAVLCQHNGCNHRVYRNIHLVQEGSDILVLGSTCIQRRYGLGHTLGAPSIGGASGRQLTTEERQLLVDNSAALLAKFEMEAAESEARLRAATHARRAAMPSWQQMSAAPNPVRTQRQQNTSRKAPWAWVKELSSVAYFCLSDKTAWVRVQDSAGVHMIMPWPTFEGWDEALPTTVGISDVERGGYRVTEVIAAVSYLRKHSAKVPQIGVWCDVVPKVPSEP